MNTAIFEGQLQTIINEFNSLKQQSQHDDLSDLPKDTRQALITRTIAAINRITGNESTYAKEVTRLLESMQSLHLHTTSIIGVAKALLEDLKSGYTRSLVEIVHSDIFADFLEMALHLCDSGYKDAAAVIAGSTLESHLRELCHKAGVEVETTKSNGDVAPKKAESMNTDLVAVGTYTKLDQKSVTAWLDLRNKAAHGKYEEYKQEQVIIMISGIRDFITRNPA
ncbi:hypothetical protein SAMN02745119_00452 [Trichlorobacter thiogenes]|uniref:DUF4145 domain-containing protein n=1 Tax=Trichlorobacter thiogenes TaxID=115783 RepID=A0A1T4KBA5_9BACT|nr:hypothetical protein [Trichlorobacter thiogenes]SJZ39657.1 hypothetical protein SAMN02745119_00452 [Trichlorobacter thiogenes]